MLAAAAEFQRYPSGSSVPCPPPPLAHLSVENGYESSSLTLHEQWQNSMTKVQIQVLFNMACMNLIASGLTDKFWARAIFYTAKI